MSFGRAEADAALKERYLPTIQEQLNNTNKFTAQIERNTKDFEGRRAVLSLHHGRNSGRGARAERGALPTAGAQKYAEERIPVYYNYGTIELTGPVIKTMKSDVGSFLRAMSSEVKGVTNDVKRDYNRQLWGTSNGVIATCLSSSGQDITMDPGTTNVQWRQIEADMFIDVGTVADNTLRATNVEVTAVDRTAQTVTVVGTLSGSVDANDFIFNNGSGGDTANATQKEVTGVQTIVDDGPGILFNIDPAIVSQWKSEVRGNPTTSGVLRAPSDTLFEGIVDDIGYESGNTPDQIWVSGTVKRAYAAGIKGQRRMNDTLEIKGGFTATSVSVSSGQEIALVDERDVPENQAYVLSTDELTHFVMASWEFMDDDGAVLNRLPGQDGYEATIFQYSELGTGKRNAHGRLDDLSGA